MRVLAIVNNFPWPGSTDGMFNLRQLQAVRDRGHDVRVFRCIPHISFVRSRKKYAAVPLRYEIEGIAVRTVRAFVPPRNFALSTLRWQTHRSLRREINTFVPDVLHVHGLLPAGAIALDAAIPFILTAHGTETYKLPWMRPGLTKIAREVVARAAACVGVSAFVASHLHRLGAADPSVIFNGADERVFHPRDRQEARAIFGLERGRPTIAFAGHIVASKGIAELQAAILALADLRPQCIIAGEGPLKNAFRERLSAAGIPAVFPAYLDHEDLANLIAACDVFAYPSHAEGLPATLCEAMNVGRAIVATDVGGIAEIVNDGETGFVVSPGDGQAFEARLRSVLNDGQLRDRMEIGAREFARAHLTWRSNAQAYERLYESVVDARRSY